MAYGERMRGMNDRVAEIVRAALAIEEMTALIAAQDAVAGEAAD